ncbi:hypothetical protein B1H26_17165 [Amycolatopsis sp. BJA-103]|nr:hypothetical protein BKN51_39450 [Amycolatopsis sp. BJA-103]PNE19744.1 hypothetical protein B1H26_17165 [Amycolatopsis sp. BJA-103]
MVLAACAVLTVAACGGDDKDNGNAQSPSAASSAAAGQNGTPGEGALNGDGQADTAAVQGLQTKLDEILNASPVRFAPQSADLTDETKATLKKVAEAAGAVQVVKIQVDTHAGYPDEAKAKELSQQRADVVSKELAAGGLAADRVKAEAGGSEGVSGDDAKAMTAQIKAAQ